MGERIPQSATIRVPFQAFLSGTLTPATGKTIAITISKNGAAYANPSAGATNATAIGSGSYYVDLSTTDTGTLGPLLVLGTEGTIDNVNVQFGVVNANNGGLAALPNTAVSSNASLLTSGTGAGSIQVSGGQVVTVQTATAVSSLANNSITAAAAAADFGVEMAAAIWQTAVAGNFTVASSIGKALYIDNVVPGASGGHLISGSNAGTTTFGALTVTGATTLTGAITGTNASNNLRINGVAPGASGGLIINGVNTGAVTLDALTIDGAFEVTLGTFFTGGVDFGDASCNSLSVTTDFLVAGNYTVSGNVLYDQNFNVTLGFNVLGSVLFDSTFSVSGPMSASNASNDFQLGTTERENIGTATWATTVRTLTSEGVQAIWDALTTAMTVAGSIGKAIVDKLTGISGANNITITVTDGVNPVQNAQFSIFDGVVLVASGTTNVSGQSTFGAPAGTFNVALYKPNFLFAGVSRTVTGNQTGTLVNPLVMTAVAPPVPPTSPDLCRLYGYIVDAMGSPLSGVTLTATPVAESALTNPVATDGGSIFTFNPIQGTSDGVGYVEIDVVQTSVLSHPVSYHITASNGQINRRGVKLNTASKDIADL